jgi:hypothetical protein
VSEREERPRGPVMLVATEALKPPKLRVGKIGENFTLPRTVPAAALVSASFFGLVFIGIFGGFVGYTVQTVMYSAVVGGGFGVFLVSYSPMRGESLARWLGLKLKNRGKRPRTIKGESVRLAVGICYIEPPTTGPVLVSPGAITIRPGSFDERGVRLEEKRWASANPIPRGSMPPAVAPDPRHHPGHIDPPAAGQFPTSPAAAFPPQPRGVNTASAMAAFRAASANNEMAGVVPKDLSGFTPVRRFGRWYQDGEQLADLYRSRPQDPDVDDPEPSVS